MLVPVIMAGGVGSRLWPLSNHANPKQFLKLCSDNTMLQDTFNRIKGISEKKSMIICNKEHRYIVAEQLRELGDECSDIILEPIGKNTAPAIALAAFYAMQENDDPLLLVLPADHLIKDSIKFQDIITKATLLAQNGKMVTFGILPNSPETGYGYIHKGEEVVHSELYVHDVKDFKEKPNETTAKQYVSSGDYLWNSGMFLFKASKYLYELQLYRPDIYSTVKKAFNLSKKEDIFISVDENIFSSCDSESIDYAVMEKTEDAVVVSMDVGWSDVGTWSSLWDVGDKDDNGNLLIGNNHIIDTQNCYIRNNGQLIATVGVSDLIIVNSNDAILIASKDNIQSVKQIHGILNK